MVIAEVIIATPVILGPDRCRPSASSTRGCACSCMGLGASRLQTVWWLWREARLPLLAALMAGFGSVISEVGAATMVGGQHPPPDPRADHRHRARRRPRASSTRPWRSPAILLALAFVVNGVLTWAQQRGPRH